MNLEVGKTYKSRNGQIFTCRGRELEDIFIMNSEGFSYYFTKEGYMFDLFPSPNIDYSKYDIIEEL